VILSENNKPIFPYARNVKYQCPIIYNRRIAGSRHTMIEQRYYTIVAEELQHQFLDPGLWTRAIAEAGGENDATRSLYIRFRVANLSEIEKSDAKRLACFIIPNVVVVLALVCCLPIVRTALMCALGIWAFLASIFLMAIVPIAAGQAAVQFLGECLKKRHFTQ
jgi:hypothetical protein